jgi:hypothetical protein
MILIGEVIEGNPTLKTRLKVIEQGYEPRTGKGQGAQSYGWSAAFAISFILDWDNDHLTWLFPKVSP